MEGDGASALEEVARLRQANAELSAGLERLRAAADSFRLAVEAAPNAMILVDAKGKMALVNRQAEELFGYSRDELLGLPIEALIPERFRPRHPAYRRDYERRPEARPMGAGRELYGLRKDGSEFPAEIGLSPISTGQGPMTLASVLDITSRRRAEAARRAEELARSNADLEQFAYAASHDLQEPLRMIAGYLELLQRKLGPRLQGDETRHLRAVVEAARRMKLLLEGLLDYSRVEREARVEEPVEVGVVLERVRLSLAAPLAEAGGALSWEPMPLVHADGYQMLQLLQNLVANAIKFRRPDAPPVIRVAAAEGPREWAFRVVDNGIGVPAPYRQKVFEMFQKLHPVSKYPGSGIGLAVCRRIVERWGGRIWVEDAPGGGSAFCFTLPRPGAPGRGA